MEALVHYFFNFSFDFDPTIFKQPPKDPYPSG